MLDVKQGQIICPPVLEQFTGVQFSIGVIAFAAPIVNVIKALLYINQYQCGVGIFKCFHTPKLRLCNYLIFAVRLYLFVFLYRFDAGAFRRSAEPLLIYFGEMRNIFKPAAISHRSYRIVRMLKLVLGIFQSPV